VLALNISSIFWQCVFPQVPSDVRKKCRFSLILPQTSANTGSFYSNSTH
jgi:hypothetical protein